MDLYAYAQIDDFEALAKANGIDVPRLRGYRLMSEEDAISENAAAEMLRDAEADAVEDLCRADPPFSVNPVAYTYSRRSDAIVETYIYKKSDRTAVVRWDRLHGKRRKAAKFVIKQRKRAIRTQNGLWSRFAGQPDVLYIHSRIGCGFRAFANQPWYLGGCVDSYDSTYCDIYASVPVHPERKADSEAKAIDADTETEA